MAKKKERIKLTFQNYRLENKSLKENIVEVQEEISLLSVSYKGMVTFLKKRKTKCLYPSKHTKG